MMRRFILCSFFLSVICFTLTGGASASTVEFDGIYDPSNWTLTNTNSDGSVNTTGAPSSISITGGDNYNEESNPGDTDFTITSPLDGNVSFDWDYSSLNASPDWDPFGYLLNGTFYQLTKDDGSVNQSESTSFSVSSGDIFGFRAHTVDNALGSATTTISNFSAPVPLPSAILLLGSGLVGLAGFRKKFKK